MRPTQNTLRLTEQTHHFTQNAVDQLYRLIMHVQFCLSLCAHTHTIVFISLAVFSSYSFFFSLLASLNCSPYVYSNKDFKLYTKGKSLKDIHIICIFSISFFFRRSKLPQAINIWEFKGNAPKQQKPPIHPHASHARRKQAIIVAHNCHHLALRDFLFFVSICDYALLRLLVIFDGVQMLSVFARSMKHQVSM